MTAKGLVPGRKLLLVTLFLTFDLIMFGAFVRVTDAGLGCPDWPGCYGKVSPIGAMAEIRAEAEVRPDGPVTVFKAWVEMLHRYVAALLGLLIIALAVIASGERSGARRAAGDPALEPRLAWLAVAWVIVQGIFGAWTVTLQLKPLVVTAHLMGAMVLFALLLAQAARVTAHPPIPAAALRLAPWIAAALAAVFLQIALGGWVSTNYATLACRDFPLCQGSAWPPMDFAAGFELWRPLGVGADGQALTFQALTAIHYAHRSFAYVVIAVVGALAWRIARMDGLGRIGRWLGIVLALQVFTGLTNIFLDWPLAAAVAHTGGATALLGLLLMLQFRVARSRKTASLAQSAQASRQALPPRSPSVT
jgi:heme a synthase